MSLRFTPSDTSQPPAAEVTATQRLPFQEPHPYRVGEVVEIEYAKDDPSEVRILRVLRPAPVASAPAGTQE